MSQTPLPTPDQDEALIALQVGRPLQSDCEVVHRCHFQLPVVSRAHPRDRKGRPFPTRYWLSCPLALLRVGRIEADGGVLEFEARRQDPAFDAALSKAHADYVADREAATPDDMPYKPHGGIAGTREGVKCLHAHLAHHWGGGDNHIGREVANRIGALDCAHACAVIDDDGNVDKNPQWVREKL